jgi:hypothetical protein
MLRGVDVADAALNPVYILAEDTCLRLYVGLHG